MILIFSLFLGCHCISISLGEKQVLSAQLAQLEELDQVLIAYPFQIWLLQLSICHILEEALSLIDVDVSNQSVHIYFFKCFPI